ncbi:hypothetical protein [Kitasatospora sp. NPDC091207]|uniref:hypothetical protein n=1 Tax=Kitasatospora sp. NPDC091207 TaxID=3364083 RepID=UPI00380D4786
MMPTQNSPSPSTSCFSIATARETAWINATLLWDVRKNPVKYTLQLSAITASVNATSNLILVPVVPPPAA